MIKAVINLYLFLFISFGIISGQNPKFDNFPPYIKERIQKYDNIAPKASLRTFSERFGNPVALPFVFAKTEKGDFLEITYLKNDRNEVIHLLIGAKKGEEGNAVFILSSSQKLTEQEEKLYPISNDLRGLFPEHNADLPANLINYIAYVLSDEPPPCYHVEICDVCPLGWALVQDDCFGGGTSPGDGDNGWRPSPYGGNGSSGSVTNSNYNPTNPEGNEFNHVDLDVIVVDAEQKALIRDLARGNFDEMDIILIDDDFGANPCLSNVYEEMGKSETLHNYLQNFDDEFSVAHLRLSVENGLPNNANASTSAPNNYVITITFNADNLNRPSLSVARTLIHEMIHAEIFRKLLSIVQEPSIVFTWEQIDQIKEDFPGLYDYYMRYEWGEDLSATLTDTQHELMAEHYRGIIVQTLKEYDDTYADEVYEALAWVGLKNTHAWNELSEEEQNNINSTISSFNSSNPDCDE